MPAATSSVGVHMAVGSQKNTLCRSRVVELSARRTTEADAQRGWS
jgi:hypothetical protein